MDSLSRSEIEAEIQMLKQPLEQAENRLGEVESPFLDKQESIDYSIEGIISRVMLIVLSQLLLQRHPSRPNQQLNTLLDNIEGLIAGAYSSPPTESKLLSMLLSVLRSSGCVPDDLAAFTAQYLKKHKLAYPSANAQDFSSFQSSDDDYHPSASDAPGAHECAAQPVPTAINFALLDAIPGCSEEPEAKTESPESPQGDASADANTDAGSTAARIAASVPRFRRALLSLFRGDWERREQWAADVMCIVTQKTREVDRQLESLGDTNEEDTASEAPRDRAAIQDLLLAKHLALALQREKAKLAGAVPAAGCTIPPILEAYSSKMQDLCNLIDDKLAGITGALRTKRLPDALAPASASTPGNGDPAHHDGVHDVAHVTGAAEEAEAPGSPLQDPDNEATRTVAYATTQLASLRALGLAVSSDLAKTLRRLPSATLLLSVDARARPLRDMRADLKEYEETLQSLDGFTAHLTTVFKGLGESLDRWGSAPADPAEEDALAGVICDALAVDEDDGNTGRALLRANRLGAIAADHARSHSVGYPIVDEYLDGALRALLQSPRTSADAGAGAGAARASFTKTYVDPDAEYSSLLEANCVAVHASGHGEAPGGAPMQAVEGILARLEAARVRLGQTCDQVAEFVGRALRDTLLPHYKRYAAQSGTGAPGAPASLSADEAGRALKGVSAAARLVRTAAVNVGANVDSILARTSDVTALQGRISELAKSLAVFQAVASRKEFEEIYTNLVTSLTCPVCRAERSNACLSCGHIACASCLHAMFDARNRRCPICQKVFLEEDILCFAIIRK